MEGYGGFIWRFVCLVPLSRGGSLLVTTLPFLPLPLS
nr:unnamed protein product [Digitaria exilis]